GIKNLDEIIDNLIIKIDVKYKDLIKELFINAIYMHDMGKINPSFQSNKMRNPDFPETTDSSNHSIYGAEIYIEKFKQKILEDLNMNNEW
ncbi:MAG: hypothetical protein KAG14_01735, partial [Mycoplasmataceae bacterium]|nr:hypothetical protein [Mycoplasmataceae bacterium]